MSAADTFQTRAPTRRPQPGSTLRLLASELRLILGRRRNQMGMLVLAALPVVMAIAIKVSNSGPPPSDQGGPPFLSSITSNGLLLAFAALAVELGLFLPLAISMVSADAIAGEANQGTLRYLLTVPVHRTRLLLVKAASLVIAAMAAVFIVAFTGLVAGVSLFGTGPLTTLSGTQISVVESIWRLALAALYVGAGIAAVGMIGLFISTLTEQPLAAMVATMIVSTLMFILDTIPQLDWLHPWLLVDRWQAFADLLRQPIHTPAMATGLLVDGAYALVFALLAWARFAGKDISS